MTRLVKNIKINVVSFNFAPSQPEFFTQVRPQAPVARFSTFPISSFPPRRLARLCAFGAFCGGS
jgi:hypothetical protein